MIYECQCEFVSVPCRLSFNPNDSAQLNYRTNLCPAGFFSRCKWEERPQNNAESAGTDTQHLQAKIAAYLNEWRTMNEGRLTHSDMLLEHKLRQLSAVQ